MTKRRETKPRLIIPSFTKKLERIAFDNNIRPHHDYSMYATDTVKGRCHFSKRYITVPLWAFDHDAAGNKTDQYVIYYLSHECAHSFAYEIYGDHTHGEKFMLYFKHLCPETLWHYELNYKPQLATAAGIRK